jgi:AcrR family transcriptional regulator
VATRGRRPGSGDTRQAILSAARNAFAENGFDRARLRSIADEAGVDPSLIVHFFGSKRELYEAAVAAPPAPVLNDFGADEESAFRVITDVITYLDRPEVQAPFIAEIRSSLTAESLDVILDRYVFLPLNAHLFDLIGGTDAAMRHAVVRAELTGVVFARYIYPREPLSSAAPQAIASVFAPTIEVYLDRANAASTDTAEFAVASAELTEHVEA